MPLTQLDEETVRSICHEYRITNAQIALRCDASADELIDVIEGNRLYIPCLYVINKIDQITIEELDLFAKVPHYVPISAHMEVSPRVSFLLLELADSAGTDGFFVCLCVR